MSTTTTHLEGVQASATMTTHLEGGLLPMSTMTTHLEGVQASDTTTTHLEGFFQCPPRPPISRDFFQCRASGTTTTHLEGVQASTHLEGGSSSNVREFKPDKNECPPDPTSAHFCSIAPQTL